MISPNIFYVVIGIGVALFIGYSIACEGSSSAKDKEKELDALSKRDYKNLAEKNKNFLIFISRKNFFYPVVLIISIGIQKLGEFKGGALFENDFVVSLLYWAAFIISLTRLIKGRTFDDRIVSGTIRGIQLEIMHPEWELNYFRRSLRNCRGLGIVSFVFLRSIIPALLFFFAIDFGIMNRFSNDFSTWVNICSSVTVFSLAASLLWVIGCRPYYLLRTRAREVMV